MSIDHQNSASYFMRNVKVKFLRTPFEEPGFSVFYLSIRSYRS